MSSKKTNKRQTATNNKDGMDIDDNITSLEEDLNIYPFKTNEEIEHARW